MITKWKLFNFKCVRDETDLELCPLTIFAGSNSSGKSTVLQSMLLISQTMSSQVGSRSVVLNGPLVKLGQFDDLRSFEGDAEQILLGWKCNPQPWSPSLEGTVDDFDRRFIHHGDLEEIACEISFDVDPSSPKQEIQQLRPRLFGCTVEAVLSERGLRNKSRISIRRALLDPVEKIRQLDIQHRSGSFISGLKFDVELDSVSLQEADEDASSARPVGCLTEHFLPKRLIVHYDAIKKQAYLIASVIMASRPYYRQSRGRDIVIPSPVIKHLQEWLGDLAEPLLGHDRARSMLFPDVTLNEWIERFRRLSKADQSKIRAILANNQYELLYHLRATLSKREGQRFRLGTRPLPREIAEADSYMERFFSRFVKYLGPLRDDPKPLYPLAANVDPTDIGLQGEYTAAVLDLHKSKPVRYLPSSNFIQSFIQKETRTRSLERAVLDWLQYMGVAEGLMTRDRGKLGHELKITTPGTKTMHDLTHVGVGVSQVLPILVMCLLAEPDTTLIIEQPELHLHPRVQTLLGDFFISLAVLKKQIIVETHSEYIVNRLRFRAAAASGNEMASLMKIYFSKKQGGASLFRDVNVNKYGAIADWPVGFFDQSLSEAEEILRAATRKRKSERQRKHNAKPDN